MADVHCWLQIDWPDLIRWDNFIYIPVGIVYMAVSLIANLCLVDAV